MQRNTPLEKGDGGRSPEIGKVFSKEMGRRAAG